MSITISGSGTISGLSAGGLPSATITQTNLATPVAGTGPAFSAYLSTDQSITTSTWTKITINTEGFDTNSNFNNTGSAVGSIPAYAFLPTVAGYYQITGALTSNSTTTTSGVSIYKNGSAVNSNIVTSGAGPVQVATLVYMNGSTDYIELYGYLIGVSPKVYGTSNNPYTYFQGVLVRGA